MLNQSVHHVESQVLNILLVTMAQFIVIMEIRGLMLHTVMNAVMCTECSPK
ncbi:hypothetical protein NST41_15460 [Paenibacillus sp. FSL L8-0696]|uniref:hypothetical protein n=1 Tax=Paenibacillus sp. FSL L8-0696 TaxID=2954524 RepID=UPI002F514914